MDNDKIATTSTTPLINSCSIFILEYSNIKMHLNDFSMLASLEENSLCKFSDEKKKRKVKLKCCGGFFFQLQTLNHKLQFPVEIYVFILLCELLIKAPFSLLLSMQLHLSHIKQHLCPPLHRCE